MVYLKELGFLGYMQKYPVNPISMIGSVVVLGILVLIINSRVRRNRAQTFADKNLGAATVTLHKKQTANYDYADNIQVLKINGEKAKWFFIKPAIPAIYFKSGKNTVDLQADWARNENGAIKMYKSDIVTIDLHASADGHYSLEYYIPEDKFIFGKYENDRIFGGK